MDSILSSVLSIFSNNPIFVLAIIAYIAFSIIKSKNTEESDDYDNYESSSSGQTWEDMEREYGISIEKKPVEPSPEDLLYDDDFYREIFKNRPIENQHPEAPLRKKGGRLFQYDDTETSEKHVEVDPSNDKTQTVLALKRLQRNKVLMVHPRKPQLNQLALVLIQLVRLESLLQVLL